MDSSDNQSKLAIFVLEHCYEDECGEHIKTIGYFSTKAKANAAKKEILKKPGFNRFPSGFTISRCVLDFVAWSDGFGFDD